MQDEIPTAKFKELLARFMDEKLLSDQSVDMAYDHLFRKGTLPFFTLTELYDTVVYMKDVMDTNHLTTLDDVLDYYDRKKRAVRAFIDTIRLEAPQGSEYTPESLPEAWTKSADEEGPSDSLPADEGYGFPCRAHYPGCLFPTPIDKSTVNLSPLVQPKKGGTKRKPADN